MTAPAHQEETTTMTDPTTPTPERPILLLGLEDTLAANSREVNPKGRIYTVAAEHYHRWLRDLIEGQYVILLSARPADYRQATLDRIWRELRWQPDELFCNEWNFRPGKCKELILHRCILPKHGPASQTWYLAVEGNDESTAMYASHGIDAHPPGELRNYPDLLTQRGAVVAEPRLF
jgi:hypothetical protein